MFTPLYDRAEVERLFERWLNGSLDAVLSRGNGAVGVTDCIYTAQGFRATGLIARYLSEDVSAAIADMALSGDVLGAAVVILSLGLKLPSEYIARALGYKSCPKFLDDLTCWIDRFMVHLLARDRVVQRV